jgi:hypothetical protein
LDIKVDPTVLSFVTRIGGTSSTTLQLINNGSDFPIEVTDVALLPGASASLSVEVPTLPLSIPVGQSASVVVRFAPTDSVSTSATLRITSDDPDEGQLDVSVGLLSFVQPLAPPDVRAVCLKDLERQLDRLNRVRLRIWGTCFLDELRGVACDAGRRDVIVAKAEEKLRAVIGGARDRHCAGASLSPSLLGLPAQCGAPCQAIDLTTIRKLADCAVCRQTAATDAMLGAAVGTVPPDLPGNQLGTSAWRCNQLLVTGTENGIRSVQRSLAGCELAAVRGVRPARDGSGRDGLRDRLSAPGPPGAPLLPGCPCARDPSAGRCPSVVGGCRRWEGRA